MAQSAKLYIRGPAPQAAHPSCPACRRRRRGCTLASRRRAAAAHDGCASCRKRPLSPKEHVARAQRAAARHARLLRRRRRPRAPHESTLTCFTHLPLIRNIGTPNLSARFPPRTCVTNRDAESEADAATRHQEANGELSMEDMSESNDISNRFASFTERASPTRASRELRASIAGLEFAIRREGWLYKNHNGGPYAKTHKRRWFISDGFHVEYFEDEARTRRTGRFDLRNVVGLGASTEVARGLDFQLSESKSGQPFSAQPPSSSPCPIPCPIPAPSSPSPASAQARYPRRSPSLSRASRRLRALRGARSGSLLSRRHA